MYFCAAFWTEKQYITNFLASLLTIRNLAIQRLWFLRKLALLPKTKFSKTSFPNSSKFYSYATLCSGPSVPRNKVLSFRFCVLSFTLK